MVRRTSDRAFTLIELSIVLIIIGLLVGGVLAGKDLITQAQLRGVNNDITRFKTAVATFQLKYGEGEYPGDFDNATAYWPGVTADGDGDGRVDEDEERVDFWQQLNLSDILPGDYNGELGEGSDEFSAANLPASAYDPGYYTVVHMAPDNTNIYYGLDGEQLGHYIELGARRVGRNGWPNSALLPAQHAQNIDQKMDDGIADKGQVWVAKGRVFTSSNAWNDNCVENEIPNSTESGAYDFTVDTPACMMWFRFE